MDEPPQRRTRRTSPPNELQGNELQGDELKGDELATVPLQDIELQGEERQGISPSHDDDASATAMNPFLGSVLTALRDKHAAPRRGFRAGLSSSFGSLAIDSGPGEAPVGAGGSVRLPAKLLSFVGFIEELHIDPRVWRIYTCLDLKDGVDVFEDDVLHHERLAPDLRDGLRRDVVVVDGDADVIYWSRTPPRTIREPGGGNGFPYPER